MSDIDLPRQVRGDLNPLAELRLDAREEWCDVGLRLDRPQTVMPFLRQLSAERRLSESVHRNLMLAEDRAGHPDRACDVFEVFSDRLLQEKKRKPSPSMYRLYLQIRNHGTADDHPSVA